MNLIAWIMTVTLNLMIHEHRFLLCRLATQLESDGSVGGRAAGGRRRLSSASGLMIGIIVAGLVVFVLVSAVFFYLDFSRKRRLEKSLALSLNMPFMCPTSTRSIPR